MADSSRCSWAAVATLCCAGVLTPLLVSLLIALGLGALTSTLDVIIFPALLLFATLAFVGWRERQAAHQASREQRNERLLRNGDEIERSRRPRQQ